MCVGLAPPRAQGVDWAGGVPAAQRVVERPFHADRHARPAARGVLWATAWQQLGLTAAASA